MSERLPRKINIGDKFGKLTVIGYDEDYVKPSGTHFYKYLCQCECGNITSVREDMLLTGHGSKGPTRSCGCIRIDAFIERNTAHGLDKLNHRLYKEYHSMMARCNKPNAAQARYKELGIYVCDEWSDQENYKGLINFFNWSMNNGYADNLTLDRIDGTGPYAPWNCRWVPMTTQANNKSNNKFITFNGEAYTYAQWERALNLRTSDISRKIPYHSIEEICYGTPDKPRQVPAIYFVDNYGNPIGIDDGKS